MPDFERSTREGYRFNTTKGFITTEDLWNLPLESNKVTSLDDIGLDLLKQLSEAGQSSLVKKRVSGTAKLQRMFDIVKHIIDTLMADIDKKENRLVAKTKNEAIRSILADKKHSEMAGKSIEELEALLIPED